MVTQPQLTSGEFQYHTACPECGSRDNLAVYSDGGMHCFGCKYHVSGNVRGGEVQDNEVNKAVSKKSDPSLISDFYYSHIKSRKISEETCKKFRYAFGTDRMGETVHVANLFEDSSSTIIAQKLRQKGKNFKWLGDCKGKHYLFGTHLWNSGRKLVVTEGELDALSVAEVQQCKWPVISVMNGAQGAAKDIAANLQYFYGFEEIILNV